MPRVIADAESFYEAALSGSRHWGGLVSLPVSRTV